MDSDNLNLVSSHSVKPRDGNAPDERGSTNMSANRQALRLIHDLGYVISGISSACINIKYDSEQNDEKSALKHLDQIDFWLSHLSTQREQFRILVRLSDLTYERVDIVDILKKEIQSTYADVLDDDLAAVNFVVSCSAEIPALYVDLGWIGVMIRLILAEMSRRYKQHSDVPTVGIKVLHYGNQICLHFASLIAEVNDRDLDLIFGDSSANPVDSAWSGKPLEEWTAQHIAWAHGGRLSNFITGETAGIAVLLPVT